MEKPGLRVSPHLRVSAGIVSIAAYKNYTTRARARVGPELIPAIPAYPQSKKQVAAGMRGYEFRQQQQKRARRSKGRGENIYPQYPRYPQGNAGSRSPLPLADESVQRPFELFRMRVFFADHLHLNSRISD